MDSYSQGLGTDHNNNNNNDDNNDNNKREQYRQTSNPFPPRRRPKFKESETFVSDSVQFPSDSDYDLTRHSETPETNRQKPKTFRNLEKESEDEAKDSEVHKLEQLLVVDPYSAGPEGKSISVKNSYLQVSQENDFLNKIHFNGHQQ